jgi:SAM-dependent methyltransferase
MTLPGPPFTRKRRSLLGFHRLHPGYCPICRKPTVFFSRSDWLRDNYHCLRCRSIPRYRALFEALELYFPQWRESLRIHESSPRGASSDKIARQARQYLKTFFFPGVESGRMHRGARCENLENQSFPDESFDLVITQDVLEHILHPERALAEIARTLKPGGTHLFTVPWYNRQKTVVRAVETGGTIDYRLPPVYHGNPIDDAGSLVVTDWGYDMAERIFQCSNLTTVAIRIHEPWKGIEAEFIEVFLSQKPG